MRYFKKLSGIKCYLSPINFDDIEKYTEWVNDMETGLYVLFGSNVLDLVKEKKLLEYLNQNDIIMAIIEKENNKAVGICGFHNRNEVHRSATFGIFIGDKNYWGHGLGTEATLLALDYAFNLLNLNSISLEVVDYNKRAIQCYEKCGFHYVGKKRKSLYMAGVYHDLLIYDILYSDYESVYINNLYKSSLQSNADKNIIDIIEK
jgi:RimJ/RimL family protein N-acetyltransferase